MKDKKEIIKDILDRECYERWHEGKCQEYSIHRSHTNTPCYPCSKNLPLVDELYDVIGDG